MKNVATINSSKFLAANKKPFDAFIWLGKNFIQLAATDEKHSKVEAIESYSKLSGNITRSEALTVFNNELIKKAKHVYVGLESKKFTLIPTALFKAEKQSEYLKAVYNIESEETINTQNLKCIDSESIYTLKKGTEKLLNEELKNTSLLHASSSLLVAYQQMLPPHKKLVSFIRLHADEILISIYKDAKLQLHKSYLIENLEDAYYHYFNILEQQKLDRKDMILSIFGKHENLEIFKDTMTSNLGTVKYVNRLPTLQYTDEVFSHPAHHFFNLFSLLLCV